LEFIYKTLKCFIKIIGYEYAYQLNLISAFLKFEIMEIYKFGGASVKDADAVKNLARIVNEFADPLVIVVSAMGKTTRTLERLVDAYFHQDVHVHKIYEEIYQYHHEVIETLFPEGHIAISEVEAVFTDLKEKIKSHPSQTFNFEYDQIVSFGEIISTTIVSLYLNHFGILSEWVDIRNVIITDSNYREARVDFEVSARNANEKFTNKDLNVFVTQGFLGSTTNNHTTTLGLEGSDYTAALLAAFLSAESVTVWKNVPGILNADPKWFDATVKLDKLNFTDAIELAFYGASVLHPKTIQPIKQNNIPLYVKSFIDPKAEGTIIGDFAYDKLIPSFIFKIDQVLINIHPENLSFIAEDNLGIIFGILAKFGLKVNLMQNTAVSFRICVNNDSTRIPLVVSELEKYYQISSESNLELITIRYYDQATIERVLVEKEVILEQHSNKNVQMVVRKID
jgi:aspartate kinase